MKRKAAVFGRLAMILIPAMVLGCFPHLGPGQGGGAGEGGGGSGGWSSGEGATETTTTTSSETGPEPAALTITDFAPKVISLESCQSCSAVEFSLCGEYDLPFVLHNSSDKQIAKLDRIVFSAGKIHMNTDNIEGQEDIIPLGNDESGECIGEPWSLGPGQTLNVQLSYVNGGSVHDQCPILSVPCGETWKQPEHHTFSGDSPASGPFTIRLEGSLSGGALWVAEATADL